MKKKVGARVFISLMLLIMYAPILVLSVYSFTSSTNIGVIREFSLDNYIKLFTTSELADMIGGSLLLALVSSFYSKKRTQSVFSAVNQIPVVNADVVTGFSVCILLVIVFGMSKDTYVPLVIGHTVLSAPFVYLSVLPKLKQMDPSLYEAALDLGAKPGYALRKVILPEIASGIVSGFALAVTLSLDDYFIATYTKPATFDTISTYVVNATKGSQTEIKTALWALSTIIFVLVLLFAIVMNLASGRGAGEEAGERTA